MLLYPVWLSPSFAAHWASPCHLLCLYTVLVAPSYPKPSPRASKHCPKALTGHQTLPKCPQGPESAWPQGPETPQILPQGLQGPFLNIPKSCARAPDLPTCKLPLPCSPQPLPWGWHLRELSASCFQDLGWTSASLAEPVVPSVSCNTSASMDKTKMCLSSKATSSSISF